MNCPCREKVSVVSRGMTTNNVFSMFTSVSGRGYFQHAIAKVRSISLGVVDSSLPIEADLFMSNSN